MDKKKTVVLAADNNYAFQMMVAVDSLLSHVKNPLEYQLVLLVSSNFKNEYIDLLNNILHKYNAISPKFFFMDDTYSKVKIQLSHITQATFFRLALPEILSDIKKCIYLDVDILVQKSIDELFEIEMDNFYLAGVKAAGFYYPEEKTNKILKTLEIPSIDQYINAGVLIINLELMRKHNLKIRFDELIKKEYKNQDQDVLNAACYGKIKLLNPQYNLMTKYHPEDSQSYDKILCLRYCYSKTEWEIACHEPVIIHFADVEKPWLDVSIGFADLWWKQAIQSNLSQFIMKMYLKELHERPVRKQEKLNTELANAKMKLQITYDEKAQRGRIIRQLQEEKKSITNKYVKQVQENRGLQEQLKQKESQINRIYASHSYKIGKIVTCFPRKVKLLIKKK